MSAPHRLAPEHERLARERLCKNCGEPVAYGYWCDDRCFAEDNGHDDPEADS